MSQKLTLWVWGVKLNIRWDYLVLQCQDTLYQAVETGRAFGMANIWFHRADVYALFSKDIANSTHLDWISCGGSCTVALRQVCQYMMKRTPYWYATCLYKSCLGRIKTTSPINFAHKRLLRLAVGCHHTLTLTVTV